MLNLRFGASGFGQIRMRSVPAGLRRSTASPLKLIFLPSPMLLAKVASEFQVQGS